MHTLVQLLQRPHSLDCECVNLILFSWYSIYIYYSWINSNIFSPLFIYFLSLLHSLMDPCITNSLIQRIHLTLRPLHPINIQNASLWIPGHIGFPKYDAVDEATNQAITFSKIKISYNTRFDCDISTLPSSHLAPTSKEKTWHFITSSPTAKLRSSLIVPSTPVQVSRKKIKALSHCPYNTYIYSVFSLFNSCPTVKLIFTVIEYDVTNH